MKRVSFLLMAVLFVLLLVFSSCSTPVDLTLDANGGTFSDSGSVYVMNVEKESAITISQIPSKEGWAFAGWYLDKDCTQSAQQLLASGIAEPVTLYAKWVQYTVTLDANGGTFSDDRSVYVMNVEKESAITVSQTPVREGWAFAGWYLDKDCTQSAQQLLASGITQPVTLYAKWEQYTITFDSKGGSGVEPIVTDGKSMLNLPQLEREGYQFDGWYFDDGEWQRPLTEETLLESPITSDATVYAKWLWLYTATFDTNGGTMIEPVKRVHNSDIDVEPPQKEGFAFNGWYADKECTAPVTKMPDHNITLYAGWYTEGLAFTQGANGYGVSVGEATAAEILLPLMHNGLPVTEIADNGFKGSAVESIEITPYITAIGQGAFENCLGLTEILIPSHVVAIKSGAFAGCSNLTIYCPIDEEDMPEGWESGWNFDRPVIWSYRFHTVTFVTGGGSQIQPQTLLFNSSINAASERDGYVFNGWYADEEATTPVTKVPDNDITVYAGWYSSGLQFDQTGDSYSVRKGFATGDIIIPYYYNGKPVTTIPLSAFYFFDDIYSVYIPDSVTDIGEEAFANCKNLTTVRLSNNLTQLKERVFLGCEKLVEITIPSSVTVVGYCAFTYCSALTSIVIPDSVTQLGESAFGQCSALQSVTLSKNLISIGKDAFRECGSLSSIVIHDKVESIGNYAFAMTNISSVFIPISVQTMGQYVFGWSRAYDVYVYCEAESRPSGWSGDWDGATTCHVQWSASRPE